MELGNDFVKSVSWNNMNQKQYIIQNIPIRVCKECSNDAVYNSDVTIKLLLLKDLMEADEVPSQIDFQKAIDIRC